MTTEDQVPEQQPADAAEELADEAQAGAQGGVAVDGDAPAGAGGDEPRDDAPADPLEGRSDEEIRDLAIQGAEYLSLAKRTRADFDNYRKRAQRDLTAARVRGGVELARELLPAIDDIERALEHEAAGAEGSEQAEHLLELLRRQHGGLVAALARGGVERFDPTGEPFDPNRHEAMAKRPAEEGEESGICGPVYQAGYAAGDEIVRVARVVVTD